MSLGPLPQKAEISFVPAWGVRFQRVPSKCAMVPVSPPTQTSLGETTQIASRSLPSGQGLDQHQPASVHTESSGPKARFGEPSEGASGVVVPSVASVFAGTSAG